MSVCVVNLAANIAAGRVLVSVPPADLREEVSGKGQLRRQGHAQRHGTVQNWPGSLFCRKEEWGWVSEVHSEHRTCVWRGGRGASIQDAMGSWRWAASGSEEFP